MARRRARRRMARRRAVGARKSKRAWTQWRTLWE
jgi:hypothetical protein